MTPVEARIYRLSATCVVLGVLSLVVPRFFPNPEGAFASGANAILALLVMLVVTLTATLYLLGATLRVYAELSPGCRAAGIGPSVIVALALLAFFGLLAY